MLGATSLSSPPHERPGSTAIVSISIPNAIGDDAATIVGKARELCRPIVGEHFLTNLQRLVWRLAHGSSGIKCGASVRAPIECIRSAAALGRSLASSDVHT